MKYLMILATCVVVLLLNQNSQAQTYERGKVIGITFQIKYPNEKVKTVSLTKEQMKDLVGITLDDDMVKTEDLSQWNVSRADWKENPTMLLHHQNLHGVKRPSTPYCRWKWHLGKWND